MSRDALVLVGILVPALAAVIVGLRQSSSTGQSAIAQQLTAIGQRLDESNDEMGELRVRIGSLERRERQLVEYAYTLRRKLWEHKIDVPEPPRGLDL